MAQKQTNATLNYASPQPPPRRRRRRLIPGITILLCALQLPWMFVYWLVTWDTYDRVPLQQKILPLIVAAMPALAAVIIGPVAIRRSSDLVWRIIEIVGLLGAIAFCALIVHAFVRP